MKITVEQKKNIAEIAEKHGLKLVVFFGSFATGKKREDSDMDIAVRGKDNISPKNIISLKEKLEEILDGKVNVISSNNADPNTLHQIEQNSTLLFGKEDEFMELKAYAFKMYHDFVYFLKIHGYDNEKIVKAV